MPRCRAFPPACQPGAIGIPAGPAGRELRFAVWPSGWSHYRGKGSIFIELGVAAPVPALNPLPVSHHLQQRFRRVAQAGEKQMGS
jgi:hypothetical protein